MSDRYVRYIEVLSNRLSPLGRDAAVAVILSACERMFFVLSRPDTRDACDQSSLRDVLEAMWEKKPVEDTQFFVPEEFEIESLSDAWANLRARSIRQDITCGLPF